MKRQNGSGGGKFGRQKICAAPCRPGCRIPPGVGKSVEQKSVTVGVSDGMNCEITSGLNAGDTVLKSSGVTMAELMEQMQAQQRTGR